MAFVFPGPKGDKGDVVSLTPPAKVSPLGPILFKDVVETPANPISDMIILIDIIKYYFSIYNKKHGLFG
jgi:hypothetical protein